MPSIGSWAKTMDDAGGGSKVLGCAIVFGASLWVLGSFLAIFVLLAPIWALLGPAASPVGTTVWTLFPLWIAIGIGGTLWITRRLWKSRARAIAAGTEATLKAVLVARMAWLIAGFWMTFELTVALQSPLDPDDHRRTWAFPAAAAVAALVTVMGYRLSIARIRMAAAARERRLPTGRHASRRAPTASHASANREIPGSLKGHGPDPDLAAEARGLRDGGSTRSQRPDPATRRDSDRGNPD